MECCIIIIISPSGYQFWRIWANLFAHSRRLLLACKPFSIEWDVSILNFLIIIIIPIWPICLLFLTIMTDSLSVITQAKRRNPWSYELLSNNKISCFNVIHGYPFEFILRTRVRCSRAISIQLIKIDLLEKRDWLCILTWSFYGGQV